MVCEKYGPVYPGTKMPIGTLGVICEEIDKLKVESDRILKRYLENRSDLLHTITCEEMDKLVSEIRFAVEQLKRIRFMDPVPECASTSYLDDPAFVQAVREIIIQWRAEHKKR